MDQRFSYLPLQYMQNCKRKGENPVVRVILYYDWVGLFLAYGLASPRLLPCFSGLVFFQLAFWTIYEIGNWENDVLGAVYEDKPHIPSDFERWRGRMRPRLAWAWAVGLSIPCALCLAEAFAPPLSDPRLVALPLWMAAGLFAGLLANLVVSRLCYALYNRIDTKTRVFVYPLMQTGKGMALALMLPVSAAGFVLLVSVVMVRQLRYTSYRTAGKRDALDVPVSLHTLCCFLLLCGVCVVLTRTAPLPFCLVAGAVAVWHLQRGRHDIAKLRHRFEWLPGRQQSESASSSVGQ